MVVGPRYGYWVSWKLRQFAGLRSAGEGPTLLVCTSNVMIEVRHSFSCYRSPSVVLVVMI